MKLKLHFLLAPLLVVAIASCDLTSPSDFTYDFIANFSKGGIVSSPMDTPTGLGVLVMNQLDVYGEKRDAIVTVAPGRIIYELPADRGGEMLFFGVGMPYALGDGAEGFVLIDQIPTNRLDTVYRRYLNPAANISDRRWFDASVDLSPYKDKAIRVVFGARPGPAGNNYADWFAWSTPTLSLPRR
jgi:hypothetical protein